MPQGALLMVGTSLSNCTLTRGRTPTEMQTLIQPTNPPTPLTRIKLVRPDVAVVDTEGELVGVRSTDGNVIPSIKGQAVFLVIKRADGALSRQFAE